MWITLRTQDLGTCIHLDHGEQKIPVRTAAGPWHATGSFVKKQAKHSAARAVGAHEISNAVMAGVFRGLAPGKEIERSGKDVFLCMVLEYFSEFFWTLMETKALVHPYCKW